MYYDSKQYTARVVQGDDGVYRWVYRMNPRRNKHPLSVVGKVFLAMGIVSAVVLRIVGICRSWSWACSWAYSCW